MTTQARPNVTPQFILGICIMLFGVLLLLERLGILVQGLRLWPVALVGLGIWVWAEPRHRRSRGWRGDVPQPAQSIGALRIHEDFHGI